MLDLIFFMLDNQHKEDTEGSVTGSWWGDGNRFPRSCRTGWRKGEEIN